MKLLAFMLALGCCFRALAECGTSRLAETSITVEVRTRDELVQAVGRRGPGTTVRIAPGTYQGGLYFAGLQGAPDNPIVLTAADPNQPPQIKGGSNCLHMSDAAFVEISHLVLTDATGNGLNMDDGGSYESPSHHVVLRGLQIRDIGPAGNRDAIKLSGLNDFVVDACTIERWGSGGSAIDMVGCHAGMIFSCTFRYRDDVPANGVQTKGGSRNVILRRCRFEHAGSRAVNLGGSTGIQFFRPQAAGYEAKDITVEDCTFIGSMAPIAFVGVDGAIVRHNTIYRPARWVIRILQETRGADFVPCRNGRFANNLVVFRSDELSTVVNVGSGTEPETFRFDSNHWYCIDRPESSARLSLPVQETGGTYGLDPKFADETSGDLSLTATSPVRDAGPRRESREGMKGNAANGF